MAFFTRRGISVPELPIAENAIEENGKSEMPSLNLASTMNAATSTSVATSKQCATPSLFTNTSLPPSYPYPAPAYSSNSTECNITIPQISKMIPQQRDQSSSPLPPQTQPSSSSSPQQQIQQQSNPCNLGAIPKIMKNKLNSADVTTDEQKLEYIIDRQYGVEV